MSESKKSMEADGDAATAPHTDGTARFRALAASMPSAIFECDLEGNMRYANERWADLVGQEMPADGGLVDRIHPDDLDALAEKWLTDRGRPQRIGFDSRCRLSAVEGTWLWVDMKLRPIVDPSGHVTGYMGALHDITDLVEARQENQRYRKILDATSDLVAVVRDDLDVQYLNTAAREAVGLGRDDEATTFDPARYFIGDEWQRVVDQAGVALAEQNTWSGDTAFRRANGTDTVLSHVIVRGTDEDGTGWYASLARDVSTAHVHRGAAIAVTRLDGLTGLLNRGSLETQLESALALAVHRHHYVGLLCLDIDQFKLVNESYGHAVGDELLVVMAARLRALSDGAVLARVGNDEFVVMVEGMSSAAEINRRARRLLENVAGEVRLSAGAAHVSVCVGVISDDGQGSARDLLRDADATVSLAKSRGRGRMEVFDRRVHDRVVTRLATELELRRGLDEQQFVLHYQPVVELESGNVTAVEALVRWEHPRYGLLLPDLFLPVVDESGLAYRLGSWVLREACETAAGWPQQRPHSVKVAVNVSADQLGAEEFVTEVQSVLTATGLTGDNLVLEVTEGIVMADPAAAALALSSLRSFGVTVAIDDFGTGYSSLSHLTRLPVDILKVDKSFVQRLGRQQNEDAVTSTVVGLGHSLGLVVIAEGVENELQLQAVRDLGCDSVQGFYFSKPLPADRIRALLADSSAILGVC